MPLWLCVIAIGVLIFNNRKLRKRYGNIPVRVKRPGKKRWTRGHAIWVSDVFAWRGSPAAWNEDLRHVIGVMLRAADPEERKKLHRLADDPAIATLAPVEGDTLEVATDTEHRSSLPGPFASVNAGLPSAATQQRDHRPSPKLAMNLMAVMLGRNTYAAALVVTKLERPVTSIGGPPSA